MQSIWRHISHDYYLPLLIFERVERVLSFPTRNTRWRLEEEREARSTPGFPLVRPENCTRANPVLSRLCACARNVM